jgi:hypothetical protein
MMMMIKRAAEYFGFAIPIGALAASVFNRAMLGHALEEIEEEDRVRSELEKIRSRESSRDAAELAQVVDAVKKAASSS